MKTSKGTQTMHKEYEHALNQGRPPKCIYCGKPLEIRVYPALPARLVWDKKKKGYTLVQDPADAWKPSCVHCGAKDWDFGLLVVLSKGLFEPEHGEEKPLERGG